VMRERKKPLYGVSQSPGTSLLLVMIPGI